MTSPMTTPTRHPWLDRFRGAPAACLDDLLRALARVPPYERATPSETLVRLFGGLDPRDPDRQLLDDTLRDWLARRREDTPTLREEYGLSLFVTEYIDALSVVWLLELPQSAAWLQDNFLDLTRWAAPMRLSKAWDLPWSLARAGALTQCKEHGQHLRLHWLRLCAEAARPSQRALIDPALIGLGNLPQTSGQGASPELIAGLARFGAGLADSPRDQADFLRRWRALKARFPRTSRTWQKLWQGVLADDRYARRPFRRWLLESEPALARVENAGAPVPIPPNITDLIKGLLAQARAPRQRRQVLVESISLLTNLERYAESTGDAYFLVSTAGNLGHKVVTWAPGHVLAWARTALRWSPSNGQAWDLRGRALVCLGRADLAQAVYWEAVRRLPDDAVVRNQLALLLAGQGQETRAEALLREAHAIDPQDETSRVELARLLTRTDRAPEAEALLRRSVAELPDNRIAPYTLASYLIAWDRPAQAAELRDHYVARFGRDRWTDTLDRQLAAGKAGVQAEREHLARHTPLDAAAADPIADDAGTAAAQAAAEERQAAPLLRAARTGAADLTYRTGDRAAAEATLDDLVRTDPNDPYPQVVWALHDAARRPPLAALYRDAYGTLAPQLAAAGPQTPDAVWGQLREYFPERTPLIDLARLVRGGPDATAAARLHEWLGRDSDPDEGRDAFLRERLHRAQERDGRIEPQAADVRDLLDTAIRGELDLYLDVA